MSKAVRIVGEHDRAAGVEGDRKALEVQPETVAAEERDAVHAATNEGITSAGCTLTVLLGLWFIEWRNRKAYVASGQGTLSSSRTSARGESLRRSQTDSTQVQREGVAMKNVYVGNFSFSTTEADLRAVFERYGAIQNVNLVHDQYTGKPRGFAFIEMADDAEAAAAITAVNGSDFGGRALVVNEARPKTERAPRSGGGGGKRTGSHFGSGRKY
jgi:hypothetical protein